MKQKIRSNILEISVISISYQSMNNQYIDIGPKKAISVDL